MQSAIKVGSSRENGAWRNAWIVEKHESHQVAMGGEFVGNPLELTPLAI
jgi:hypothetical protein